MLLSWLTYLLMVLIQSLLVPVAATSIGLGWGGWVGWGVGGIITSFCWRSDTCAHIHHTVLYVLTHLRNHVMLRLRLWTFSCMCTHTSCYAAARSHACAHIRHVMLLHVLLHLHTYVMLSCCTFSCTCIITSCYAAVRSHALA